MLVGTVLKKKSHSSHGQFVLVLSFGLFYNYTGRMGGDQISIIVVPVVHVIPQVSSLSRNYWCWFQQFYQLWYCRCFFCQNTPTVIQMQEEKGYLPTACMYTKETLTDLQMLWNRLSFAVHKFPIYWAALPSLSPAGMILSVQKRQPKFHFCY